MAEHLQLLKGLDRDSSQGVLDQPARQQPGSTSRQSTAERFVSARMATSTTDRVRSVKPPIL